MTKYILRELPAYYISYDEPNAEENWNRVRELLPLARRVHGVKGFDKAHKTCAMSCHADRFLTIDGDNWLLPSVLDHELDDTGHENVVFSFRSQNDINGLEYGNGGLKVWNAAALLNSNTHEHGTDTDFCWTLQYYQVDVRGSIARSNGSQYQAWRAGYREGVKMSYINGVPMKDPRAEYNNIWYGNRSRLNIWMSVGRDADNGEWAMLGARQGFCDLYSGQIKNTDINDYDWFSQKWQQMNFTTGTLSQYLSLYGSILSNEFGVYVPELNSKQSTWFKSTFINPPRSGLML